MKSRWLNHIRAVFGGYWWLPCRLCGQMFGGHERLPNTAELPSEIVIRDTGGVVVFAIICPDCTREGLGRVNHVAGSAAEDRD